MGGDILGSEERQFVEEFRKKIHGRETITCETISGSSYEFDVTPSACGISGFNSGDIVDTPNGKAVVIGVKDKGMYFYWLRGEDKRAAHYDNILEKNSLAREGFTLIEKNPD